MDPGFHSSFNKDIILPPPHFDLPIDHDPFMDQGFISPGAGAAWCMWDPFVKCPTKSWVRSGMAGPGKGPKMWRSFFQKNHRAPAQPGQHRGLLWIGHPPPGNSTGTFAGGQPGPLFRPGETALADLCDHHSGRVVRQFP